MGGDRSLISGLIWVDPGESHEAGKRHFKTQRRKDAKDRKRCGNLLERRNSAVLVTRKSTENELNLKVSTARDKPETGKNERFWLRD